MTVSTSGVAVTTCRQEDAAEVQAFFADAYRPGYVLARDAALFDWQFGGAGNATKPHLLLARRESRVVAALGYIPVTVNMAGATVSGAWTCNWISSPDEPCPAGPFLMRELTRRHDVTLALGLSGQARVLLPRLGFAHAQVLRRLVRVLDVTQAQLLAPDDARPTAVRANAPTDRSAARQVPAFTEDVAAAWDSAQQCGTRRDLPYLAWRYAGHPRFRYDFWEARDGRLRAIGVARTEQASGLPARVTHIVDLAGGGDDAAEVADAIARDAAGAGVALVDACVTAGATADALVRRGWRDASTEDLQWLPRLLQPVDHRRSDVHFMAHVRGGAAPRVASPWHVMLGDGDQDRPN